VRSFAASWLQNRPAAWQSEPIKRLRVRLGEYEALDHVDRCLWVADLLDQEAGGPLRAGANRFETLLQPFGLDGQIADDCRKTLFELSQVRNTIVHRRCRADRKLVDGCPWLDLVVGDRVKISHDMWERYGGAVGEYVLELIHRVRATFGLKRYEPGQRRVLKPLRLTSASSHRPRTGAADAGR